MWGGEGGGGDFHDNVSDKKGFRIINIYIILL